MNTTSREYLVCEMNRLRELWGTKSFWADPAKASRAMLGLLFVWSRTENPEPHDIVMMQATCDEFDRRLAYALVLSAAA